MSLIPPLNETDKSSWQVESSQLVADGDSSREIDRVGDFSIRGDVAASAIAMDSNEYTVIIEKSLGWRVVNIRELYEYRDLFRFLVWREVKVRYSQSAIGIGWAVIQPVFSMLVFTIVFGRLAKVESGGAPYALFSLAGLTAWTYLSNSITEGVNGLVGEANMLRKVYFPRLLLPFCSIAAKLVDLSIAMICLLALMLWNSHYPPLNVIHLPMVLVLMMLSAASISLWLSALAIQYRDVKHALTFLTQLGLYASPVVYPASLIPEKWRALYAINPAVGAIEGFRACLLREYPMPWLLLGVSTLSMLLLLTSGLVFFKSREKVFADVA